MKLLEAISYGIIVTILNQTIIRIVGFVWSGGAGVVFERIVGGHFAAMY